MFYHHSHSQIHTHSFSLTHSLTHSLIHSFSAYRGKGQINRTPGVWLSEWVDLTLIHYTNTSLYGAFSIVWDDVGQDFRHLMDFSMFQSQAPVPLLDYEIAAAAATTTTTATTTATATATTTATTTTATTTTTTTATATAAMEDGR